MIDLGTGKAHLGCFTVGVLVVVAAWLVPSSAWAQSDGVQLCDGSGTAVSKPVGNEQWSVQYDPRLNTANGTVFNPATQTVQFVSCIRETASRQDFTFVCTSPAADDPNRWDVFASDVSVAPQFFRLPDFYVEPSLAALAGGRLRAGTDKGGSGVESYFLDLTLDAAPSGEALRGRNLATGKDVAIITTYGADRAGGSPANYLFTEFGDGVCEFVLFNVQLFPPATGDFSTSGLFAGAGQTVPRNEDGTCSTSGATSGYGASGVMNDISARFRRSDGSTAQAFTRTTRSLLE